MHFDEIIFEKKDRVATVTMNRPERMNAWTPKMGAEMRAAMMDAERDPSIGAIIVTGAGRAYCAGADMGALSNIAQGNTSARSAEVEDEWMNQQRADYRNRYSWPLALSTPVIGAINGACVGLGFTTCLYQDIRIASENARMGLIFTQRGLAIEHGSSWMLPRIIGLARATELAITGRLVDAKEALEIGLVNRVAPQDKLMSVAHEIASGIASKCSPLGVAQAKKMIYQHLFTDLATGVREDDASMEMMTRSEDFKEGVKAFVEKRAPKFTGR
ncbi:MAG: enoyl-CoA hydratase-related protein [Candidatus Binatus sp.]|uniref:enoyl-CoA hydratase-related protein n=1 Tax=Candidatus Binatus sp. TaxID=2811406 RepID=UPI00272481E0|nr:enoyl-CoA hydratase-related protein [Candidatus Binatus sp.]MDO8434984.1 enoyl-CoA hydratase-related protein [Candidatus Binatus sp.]